MSSQPLMEHELTREDQHDIADNGTNSRQYCSCYNQPAPAQPRRRTLTILQVSLQVFLIILLIANLLTLTFVSQNQQIRIETSIVPNSAAAIFNITSNVLRTQYGSDVSYMSLDPQYDLLWSSENDKYAGLIVLDPPNTDGSIRWGAITMLHQLHCISALRTALQRAQRGGEIGIDYRDDSHWPHCLHYLRQGIICHADDTIELPYTWNTTNDGDRTTTTKRTGAIDGSQDTRVCRNPDELYRLRAERGYREGQD